MEIHKQLEKTLIAFANSDIIKPTAALYIQICSRHILRNIVSELYQIDPFFHSLNSTFSPWLCSIITYTYMYTYINIFSSFFTSTHWQTPVLHKYFCNLRKGNRTDHSDVWFAVDFQTLAIVNLNFFPKWLKDRNNIVPASRKKF